MAVTRGRKRFKLEEERVCGLQSAQKSRDAETKDLNSPRGNNNSKAKVDQAAIA